MLRVGVPEQFDPSFRHFFPQNVEIVIVPDDPQRPVEVEFWIVPYMSKTVAHVLPFMRGVKVLQALSAGIDAMVDSIPKGATLCDGQGIHDIPVAEWVVGAVLASLKFFPLYDDIRRTEEWTRRSEGEAVYRQRHPGEKEFSIPRLGEDLAGKHILIVGYGAIGKAIEHRLTPFDVTFTRVARHKRDGVDEIGRLDELLPQADIVIVIVPLTSETQGMFDARRIALLKRGALLVNAARGPVVVTDALVDALRAYRICAALDVTDPEPLPQGHPLWTAPNLFLTPHVAGGSPRFLERAYTLAGQQVERYLKGEPLINVVTNGY
jgi:phosphoglycerate dehydrogenase-like enzyme